MGRSLDVMFEAFQVGARVGDDDINFQCGERWMLGKGRWTQIYMYIHQLPALINQPSVQRVELNVSLFSTAHYLQRASSFTGGVELTTKASVFPALL